MLNKARAFITIIVVTVVFLLLTAPIHAQVTEGEGADTPITETLTEETFTEVNPLKVGSVDSPNCGENENCEDRSAEFSKPAGIVSRALFFAFPIAGLILFVMLIWAGFEMLSGASTKKSMDAGRQRATTAVVGFILLFVSYWAARLLEVVFGITIL